jgi:tetratricopeptide (TPR) repeat protein
LGEKKLKITEKEFENKITILTNKLKVNNFNEVIKDGLSLIKKVNHPILYNILSLAFQGKGDFDNSIKIIDEGLKLDPKNIFFLNNIGLSYYKKNELSKAEEYYNRAIEINPNYINTLNNLATLKKDLDLVDEAIELFEKSLKLNDKVLETNYNLASILQSIGKFDQSIKYFMKTLEINPKFTKADRNIAMMTSYNNDNEHFLKMKKKISETSLSKIELHELHFAIGKAYEDLKNHPEAFDNYSKANNYKKEITGYNIKKDREEFNSLKKIFNKNLDVKNSFNTKKLIFILGMPRSGTSLAEQIISSHSEVYGGGELIFLTDIIYQNFYSENKFLNISESKSKIQQVQNNYIKKISLIDSSEKSFTDKAPLNFKWIGYILNIFPNVKIVHCKRDPLDNCWSLFKNNFDGNLNFSNNLSDLGEYYKIYVDLMSFWKQKFPNKIYDLVYEHLTRDQENETKKLLKFCELSWDENCLKHHENKKSIKTVSFGQARKPIYKSSINSSEKYEDYLNELKSILN